MIEIREQPESIMTALIQQHLIFPPSPRLFAISGGCSAALRHGIRGCDPCSRRLKGSQFLLCKMHLFPSVYVRSDSTVGQR